MCVAIVVPKGKRLTAEHLKNGWNRNGDGAGFAYVHEDKVVIRKGFMKYEDLETAYLDAADKYSETSPFLVHMRIRTSGRTDDDNTHPFKIKGGALIHNGVLFHPERIEGKENPSSDTKVLANSLHNVLVKRDVILAKSHIEEVIRSNKIAMLYDDGDYLILNEKLGDWKDGIWFSNSSCSSPPYNSSSRGSLTPSGK